MWQWQWRLRWQQWTTGRRRLFVCRYFWPVQVNANMIFVLILFYHLTYFPSLSIIFCSMYVGNLITVWGSELWYTLPFWERQDKADDTPPPLPPWKYVQSLAFFASFWQQRRWWGGGGVYYVFFLWVLCFGWLLFFTGEQFWISRKKKWWIRFMDIDLCFYIFFSRLTYFYFYL